MAALALAGWAMAAQKATSEEVACAAGSADIPAIPQSHIFSIQSVLFFSFRSPVEHSPPNRGSDSGLLFFG
jgi:hypothetical protein